MSLEFLLRPTRSRGKLIAAGSRPAPVRGRLEVAEGLDEELRRTVRRAVFSPTDRQAPPVPPLHDVVLLSVRGDWMALTGFEEVPDGPLMDMRRYQQTWHLAPAAIEELDRAMTSLSLLAEALHRRGVEVRRLPSGDIVLPGEPRWPDHDLR